MYTCWDCHSLIDEADSVLEQRSTSGDYWGVSYSNVRVHNDRRVCQQIRTIAEGDRKAAKYEADREDAKRAIAQLVQIYGVSILPQLSYKVDHE